MKTVTVKVDELLALIRSEPDADMHISTDKEGVWVTNEWLCGGFCGRAFVGKTEEEAAQQLIDYLDAHVGHKSVVGRLVTESGWPDLGLVKRRLVGERELVEVPAELVGVSDE